MIQALTVTTPAGGFVFSAKTDASGKISLVDLDAELPGGMETEFHKAAILQVSPGHAIKHLSFSVELPQAATVIGPESGQFLEAHAWTCGRHVIYTGTEDGEALRSRLGKSVGLDENSVVTNVKERRMTISIPNCANSDGFSLHIAVATNSCLLYTSPSPRDATLSRMPSSA